MLIPPVGGTFFMQPFSTTYGTRTRDSSVKGRRLNLLTNAAFILRGRQRYSQAFSLPIFFVINMLIHLLCMIVLFLSILPACSVRRAFQLFHNQSAVCQY